MNLEKFKALITESHGRAKRKGWHDDGPRSDADYCLNVHGEISEAMEDLKRGKMGITYADDGKPLGFGIELGDVVIREADWFGASGLTPIACRCPWVMHDIGSVDALAEMHAEVTDWYRSPLDTEKAMISSLIIAGCFAIAEAHNIDLWECIRIKSEFNETRPHRHGGKAF